MHYGIQPKPTRYNGKCKRCGARVSVLAVEIQPSHTPRQVDSRGFSTSQVVDVAIDDQGRRFDFYDGFWIRIPHECVGGAVRNLRLQSVRGVYNPGKECNAKCLAAIGHDCECRCGGKNHGAGFTVS